MGEEILPDGPGYAGVLGLGDDVAGEYYGVHIYNIVSLLLVSLKFREGYRIG